jgi:hypothetical protein
MDNQAILTDMLRQFEALEKVVPLPEPLLEDALALPDLPRAEIGLMFRRIATDAGYASACSNRRCRRTGQCTGSPGLSDDRSCNPLWDADAAGKLETACFALILAWRAELGRLCQRFDLLQAEAAFGFPWFLDEVANPDIPSRPGNVID